MNEGSADAPKVNIPENASPFEPRVALTVPELQAAADHARTQYANEAEFQITVDVERRQTLSLLQDRAAGKLTDQQVADIVAARMGEVRTQGDIDQLTDLYNRKGALNRSSEILATARRTGAVTTAMMIDLDNFKDANEALGHTGGDAALYSAGRNLRDESRVGDMVSRWGGDEFFLMLQSTTADNAAKVVASKLLKEGPDEITESVDGMGFKLPKPITYSIGIAEEIPRTEDRSPIQDRVKDLNIRADKASSVAKKLGKNRIVIARVVKGEIIYTDLTTNQRYTIKEDEKGNITAIMKLING